MPLLKKLLVGTGLTALGVGGFVATRPKPAPFHTAYPPLKIKILDFDVFPYFHFMMSNIPETWRQKLVVKMNAPKPDEIKDRYDCLGESPYTVKEIVPDKMWRVAYEVGMSMFAGDEAKEKAKFFGTDPNDPGYRDKARAGAANYGEKAIEVVEEDIKKGIEMFAKGSITNKELIELASWTLNSYVVKLNGGGLLLYAPIKIREETGFAEWIDSLGKVEWLVIASSAHTLNIQPVVQRYPEAKVIGPPSAEAKLNHISALPRGKVDFDSTNADELSRANESLASEGVKLYDVAGDVVTNALVAVYDKKQLMSCDLIYTHADGDGFLLIDKDKFRQFLPEDWLFRLFRYNTMAKPNGPNGFLPTYRYQLMDPNCLGVVNYTQPAWDGSSCKSMAQSLRDLLKAEFEYANGVHFDQMKGEVYADAMDKNWNWLDGKPLV